MEITKEIAKRVGDPLGRAEHAWTLAVRDGAIMTAAVAQAAIDAGLPVGLVSELVEQSVQGLSRLDAVGQSYAGLHGRMSAIARKAGLDPSMFGQSLPGTLPNSGQLAEVEVPRKAA